MLRMDDTGIYSFRRECCELVAELQYSALEGPLPVEALHHYPLLILESGSSLPLRVSLCYAGIYINFV